MKTKFLKPLFFSIALITVFAMFIFPAGAEELACDGCTWGTFNGSPACLKNGNLHICEKNFPDENFRGYIADNFDKSKDGIIQKDIDDQRPAINCQGLGITSLKGTEYFTGLISLICCNNKLTALDVSKNKSLHSLHCDNNQLTTLDVGKLQNLTDLFCDRNALSTLDLSNNRLLTYLDCSSNKISELDVSMLSNLKGLYVSSNNLTALDVSANKELNTLKCSQNMLMGLDLSKNPKLAELEAGKQNLLKTPEVYASDGNVYFSLREVVGDGNLQNVKVIYVRSNKMDYDSATGIATLSIYGTVDVFLNISLHPDAKLSSGQTSSISFSFSYDCPRHYWIDATCMQLLTCKHCGKTSGSFASHTWSDATCQSPRTCTVCGITKGKRGDHIWYSPGCDSKDTCQICGKTTWSTSTPHTWEIKNLGLVKECTVCGTRELNRHFHSVQELFVASSIAAGILLSGVVIYIVWHRRKRKP